MKDFFFLTFMNLIVLVMCLVGMAFFTLLEQKFLGSSSIRKGPFYVGYLGFFQPFSDALKLYSTGNKIFYSMNYTMAVLFSSMMLFYMMLMWAVFPFSFFNLNMKLGVLFILLVMGLTSMSLLLVSWFSNCKYSLLGGLRTVSQMISYEVSLAFCLLSFSFFLVCLNFLKMKFVMICLFNILPLLMLWLPTILAETNRTPFDFSEGESELVSGFNTELGGFSFAFCFMGEYLSMLFISVLSSYIFFSTNFFFSFFFFFFFFFFIFFCFVSLLATSSSVW